MTHITDWLESRNGGAESWGETQWGEWSATQFRRVGREPRPYRSIVAAGLFLRADALGYASQRDRWHLEWERLGGECDEDLVTKEAIALAVLERIARVGQARRDRWTEADEWDEEHRRSLPPIDDTYEPTEASRVALLQEIAETNEAARAELAWIRMPATERRIATLEAIENPSQRVLDELAMLRARVGR